MYNQSLYLLIKFVYAKTGMYKRIPYSVFRSSIRMKILECDMLGQSEK